LPGVHAALQRVVALRQGVYYQGITVNETINTVELAAELTAAWLANPNTRTSADDVPAFLLSMHAAVAKLAGGGEAACADLRTCRVVTQVVGVAGLYHLDARR
jgi:hypothetical protein